MGHFYRNTEVIGNNEINWMINDHIYCTMHTDCVLGDFPVFYSYRAKTKIITLQPQICKIQPQIKTDE